MHIYNGSRTDKGCEVTIDGRLLNPRNDLRNHSPEGFNWGYQGSGPAQLALAMLAAEFDPETAQAYYQEFKREIIGRIHVDEWEMTSDVLLSARCLSLLREGAALIAAAREERKSRALRQSQQES